MRYLITGVAGFIGSHITERLLKEGNFVRVLDNFSSGRRQNLSFTKEYSRNFELIKGDIRNQSTCNKACLGIDYILHQAALRSVPKSMIYPLDYNEVNINGILFLLQTAYKNKVRRFVFASSSSVYGDTKQFPEKEDTCPLPISPYALSKLAGEHFCRIFTNTYGLETVVLRYFNVFGPKQALDDEYAAVIPKFIRCILHNEQPPIFGTGKQSRDFTYIDDVVEANILAATKDNIKHEIFNVANGKNETILELVEILNKIIGKDIKPKFLSTRVGDVFKTLADVTKIKQKLGFISKKTFEVGLAETVEYFSRIYNK